MILKSDIFKANFFLVSTGCLILKRVIIMWLLDKFQIKVRTFWEAHKNLSNLPHALYIYLVNSKRQPHEEDFYKFCVLLRKSELYECDLKKNFIHNYELQGVYVERRLLLTHFKVVGSSHCRRAKIVRSFRLSVLWSADGRSKNLGAHLVMQSLFFREMFCFHSAFHSLSSPGRYSQMKL